MSKNFNVTLDTSVTPNALKVHDHGHIHVDKKASEQTITWNLTGTIASGAFVPMSDDPPGFMWIEPAPPAGIFGEPTIGSNGNALSITDDHTDSSSDGSWIYQLRVSYDGAVYQTTASLPPDDTVNDPTIINH